MAAQDQINVGVIGVGWFGELHALIYDRLLEACLIGVTDADPARAAGVAARLGVRAFPTTTALLADDTIEAVSIATSDHNHVAPALAAARAGKHILVEKPLALTLEDCDLIISAAEEADVQLMCGHVLRFNLRYLIAKDKIRKGEIGKISHFSARRTLPRSAGHRVAGWAGYHGALFHLAVHDVDLLQWLADDEIVEVYSRCRAGAVEAEGSALSDIILSLVRFRNGALALLEHGWIYPDTHPILVDARTEITGEKGKIIVDLGGGGAISYTPEGINHFECPYWPTPEGWLPSDLRDELETFIRCLLSRSPVAVTGQAGRKAIAVVLAIRQSLDCGQVVIINT